MAVGSFDEMLKAERRAFPSRAPDPVRLLVGPTGQPWYQFQVKVYSTWVRAVSVLHVLFMAVVLATLPTQPMVAKALAWVMAVDIVIFEVLGPTPLAPVSTLAVLLVWRFRGSA